MKTILINASPRRTWNTAQLVREAQKGAESVGAQTEYIDLYDLRFTGCRSCLACKRKDAERCRCYWNDDLSPVISRVLEADALIIGSPIYFGEPTAGYRAFLERLLFCVLSYDVGDPYFKGRVNTGIIYTMNAPREYYENGMSQNYKGTESMIARMLNGGVRTVAACNTVQVDDYSRYAMGRFSEEEKKAYHDAQFPLDMEAAFRLGAELSSRKD